MNSAIKEALALLLAFAIFVISLWGVWAAANYIVQPKGDHVPYLRKERLKKESLGGMARANYIEIKSWSLRSGYGL